MQPRLVCEGRPAGVRLVGVGCNVGDLCDGVRDADGLLERAVGQTVDAELDLQVGDHHEEVSVAGAFTISIRGDLHVRCSGLDRRHRVGDGAAGVVLAVDAQSHPRALEHVRDDRRDAVGEHAAVGVAQDAYRRTRLGRRTQ